jgi:4-hydroxy-3-polyprenylbenzoate decarboxylase
MSRARADDSADLVVAMTGASGAPYAVRLIQVLCHLGRTVHISISPSAVQVLREETGRAADLEQFDPATFGELLPGRLVYHHYQNFMAGIASGSFPTAGMVIVPCSMSTMGAIASGTSTNLITRAADVHLKERRTLILVPRETPLSLIHLENMLKVTQAGAVVLPAMPGWYHRPTRLDDLVDFVVGRICDQLGIPNSLIRRWGRDEVGEPQDDANGLPHTVRDAIGPERSGENRGHV